MGAVTDLRLMVLPRAAQMTEALHSVFQALRKNPEEKDVGKEKMTSAQGRQNPRILPVSTD